MISVGPAVPGDIHPFIGLDVPRLLARRAEAASGQPFLLWEPVTGESQTLTYGQFRDRVRALAAGLSQRSVRSGDRVIIHLENCPQFLECWFACSTLGAVAITTNTQATATEFSYFVEHSKASAIITQPGLLPVVTGAKVQVRLLCCASRNPDGSRGAIAAAVPLEDCYGSSSDAVDRNVDPLADNSVQYTSGTTSRPKGVLWTHANALWGGAIGAAHLGLRADDVGLAYMPLFHTNALCYSMLATLWAGGALVLMPKFSAGRFWPVALQRKCTWASMIPFAHKALLSQPDPVGRHSFRLWGCPHSDPAVEQRWGIHTVGWWGMTETISQCIVGYRHLTNRPGAMGSAAPEYEVSVRHPDGRPVSPGETGRLLVRGVRGVSIFKEYLNDPETTAASFDDDGWFETGDMITLTESGQFQFADREKDVLKVGGENVSASEVERVILGVAGVAETAVVGRPHEMLDEVPVAFVIAAEKVNKALEQAILAQCRTQLARFKVPTEVIFVEDFARAALNKIDKTRLRAQLRNAAAPKSA